ncbi:hypothetical protein AX15_004193 [Amanita polypyramis BW_CC]|nr:hypothetical protein AX15_004193 [Amanita polypyramis BW_CC]
MTAITTDTSQNQYRLPVDVKPTHYDVTIRTDLEKLAYQGFVKISLNIKKDTSRIVLNSSELKLTNVTIYSDALKTAQEPSSQSYDSVQGRAVFDIPTPLPASSKAELKIGFEGKLGGGMVGYYKSSYELDGEIKYYALTQFEVIMKRFTETRRIVIFIHCASLPVQEVPSLVGTNRFSRPPSQST